MLDNFDECIVQVETDKANQGAEGALVSIPASLAAELSRLARIGIWSEAQVYTGLEQIIKNSSGDPNDRSAQLAKHLLGDLQGRFAPKHPRLFIAESRKRLPRV